MWLLIGLVAGTIWLLGTVLCAMGDAQVRRTKSKGSYPSFWRMLPFMVLWPIVLIINTIRANF